MAIFRCNACGHLQEGANEHVGKSVKSPKCESAAGIHEKVAQIEPIPVNVLPCFSAAP